MLHTAAQLRAAALTVSEAARLYNLRSFDTALPLEWVRQCQDLGFNPVGSVVWCYDHSAFGEPFPLSTEADTALRQVFPGIELKAADYYHLYSSWEAN